MRAKIFTASLLLMCFTATAQTGNVGVGTAIPLKPLHIVKGVGSGAISTGQTSVLIEGDAAHYISMMAPSGLETGILYGRPGGSIRSGIIFDGSSGMRFRTGGNTTRMLLDSVGKLGIGSNTPVQKLDVNGKIKLGDDAEAAVAGTIRWNTGNNDFEGFDGTQWLSLTRASNAWPQPCSYGAMGNYSFVRPADVTNGKHFGTSVAIEGDYAVIGAPNDAADRGAAYVFFKSGGVWAQQAKLVASDAVIDDFFGTSVAISGDYIIVGAIHDYPSLLGVGAAYVFKRTGIAWAQEAKITEVTASTGSQFGYDVSISGDYAVIGAIYDDAVAAIQGQAFVFKRTGATWAREAILTDGSLGTGDEFGCSVSIDGDYVAVGAQKLHPTPQQAARGKVFIYKRTGIAWNMERRVETLNQNPQIINVNNRFGCDVSISGDKLIVGNFSEKGVYFYERSGTDWINEQRIEEDAPNNGFGKSVYLKSNIAIVGAKDADGCSGTTTVGRAFVYKLINGQWTLSSMFLDPSGKSNDNFGTGVCISGNEVIVGSPLSLSVIDSRSKAVFGKVY